MYQTEYVMDDRAICSGSDEILDPLKATFLRTIPIKGVKSVVQVSKDRIVTRGNSSLNVISLSSNEIIASRDFKTNGICSSIAYLEEDLVVAVDSDGYYIHIFSVKDNLQPLRSLQSPFTTITDIGTVNGCIILTNEDEKKVLIRDFLHGNFCDVKLRDNLRFWRPNLVCGCNEGGTQYGYVVDAPHHAYLNSRLHMYTQNLVTKFNMNGEMVGGFNDWHIGSVGDVTATGDGRVLVSDTNTGNIHVLPSPSLGKSSLLQTENGQNLGVESDYRIHYIPETKKLFVPRIQVGIDVYDLNI